MMTEKDDLQEFHPNSFIETYKKYKLVGATPIIKDLLKMTKFY